MTYVMEEYEFKPIVEVEKTIESWGNLILSMEYRNNASILSVSYKNPTLNLILPVLFIDSLAPTIISAAIYLLGCFYRRKIQPVMEMKKK